MRSKLRSRTAAKRDSYSGVPAQARTAAVVEVVTGHPGRLANTLRAPRLDWVAHAISCNRTGASAVNWTLIATFSVPALTPFASICAARMDLRPSR